MQKTKSFHNTIGLKGKDLEKATVKTLSQEQTILELFKEHKALTYSQVQNIYPKQAPMSSIARAISNLKHEGKIKMTDKTVLGNWGKPNHIYVLKQSA